MVKNKIEVVHKIGIPAPISFGNSRTERSGMKRIQMNILGALHNSFDSGGES